MLNHTPPNSPLMSQTFYSLVLMSQTFYSLVLILAPIVALVGSATGFYFGGNSE